MKKRECNRAVRFRDEVRAPVRFGNRRGRRKQKRAHGWIKYDEVTREACGGGRS